jgi:hypothetical protein
MGGNRLTSLLNLQEIPMSLSDLASIGSFVSGVAVAVTLVLLLLQMRQNTRAVRAAASQEHTAAYHSLTTHLIDSSAFANIWRRGIDRFDTLTDDERVSFFAFLSALFRFFEASRLQWKHGQLDKEHWHNIESNIRACAPIVGVQEFWKVRGDWHSPEFRLWFESLPRTSKPIGYGWSTQQAQSGPSQ